MSKKHTRRTRRKFTAEYKAEVVALVRTEGNTVGQVAADLDLTASSVRRWVDASEPKETTLATVDESAELKQLRAENKRLRMERDILVKATAFFVKEST